MSKKKVKKKYIDKYTFYIDFLNWRLDSYNNGNEWGYDQGEDGDYIPEGIIEGFLLIANNLARKGNFSGYSFRDDMIQEGLYRCINGATRFNPFHGIEAFSYYTTTCNYAFISLINEFKHQRNIESNYKYFSNFVYQDNHNPKVLTALDDLRLYHDQLERDLDDETNRDLDFFRATGLGRNYTRRERAIQEVKDELLDDED